MKIINSYPEDIHPVFFEALAGCKWAKKNDKGEWIVSKRKNFETRAWLTSLLSPMQMLYLEWQHWDDITIEAASLGHMIDGSSDHYILGRIESETAEKEFKMQPVIEGIRVVFKPDVYSKERREVVDYKRTTVWQYVHRDEKLEEWEKQLNSYAACTREIKKNPVERLAIQMRFRDWSRSRSNGGDYPDTEWKLVPIKVWSHDRAIRYVTERVRLYKEMLKGNYAECTDDERWKKDDTWALWKKASWEGKQKGKQTKAAKVFTSEHEAEDEYAKRSQWRVYIGKKLNRGFEVEEEARRWAQALKNTGKQKVSVKRDEWHIEPRPARNVRCEEYCNARDFCPQFRRIQIVNEKVG